MSVLLTHGYFLAEDAKEQEIMRPYPPLGLLYISAFLLQNGIENKVLDSTFSSFDNFKDYIHDHQPKVIAIYTNLMTKIRVLEMAKYAKEILPETSIIFGGPDVTYNTENYLKHGADYLVIGEGENSMLELTQHLLDEKKEAPKHIDGIAFMDDNGSVVKTNARTKVRDIDELPIPNRSAIDIPKYLDVWKEHHGQNAINISTQRGCPYTCKWCSTAVYGQSYRRRSPKLVVEELKQLIEEYKPDTFWFVDDVFTVSHKWLKEFCETLTQENVSIQFECISRADRMNSEVISLLKEAGCFRVWIGAESGSQKIVDAMDRRVSVEHVRDMIVETQKHGIQAGTFIMLGYPGETMEDIKETIHHLKVSNPDHFTITVAYPIKGTSLYDDINHHIITDNDWATSTDRDIDFKRTYSRRFYDFAVKYIINEVQINKSKGKKGGVFNKAKLRLKSKMASIGMLLSRKGLLSS
ncbi:B12-binding domain-containing radical SAM protein [Roseivirga pacifica]|uniref:B12-binding domain-containing radical SAM protein n=1 Tax=Roseivirga pacifica TaxID=1267423 RepID=UPI003BAF678F